MKQYYQQMAKIILHTTFLCECIIVIIRNIGTACSDCNGYPNSRAIYVPATQLANDTAKSYKMNDTLNSCQFGKIHGVLERNICFDHCYLRSHCMAVETSVTCCRFCLDNDYDPSREMEYLDWNAMYINENTLEGR